MTTKKPAESGKPWKPGDPLRLDKAIRKDPANDHLADRLDRAGEATLPPVRQPLRAPTPANHKSFNRQKKG